MVMAGLECVHDLTTGVSENAFQLPRFVAVHIAQVVSENRAANYARSKLLGLKSILSTSETFGKIIQSKTAFRNRVMQMVSQKFVINAKLAPMSTLINAEFEG